MQIDIKTSNVKPIRNTYKYVEKRLAIKSRRVIRKPVTIFKKKLIFTIVRYGNQNMKFLMQHVPDQNARLVCTERSASTVLR
jgi:hypothetical protein